MVNRLGIPNSSIWRMSRADVRQSNYSRDEARQIAAKDATGICVQLAAQTMSVPILTVTLSAKLELHWSTKL